MISKENIKYSLNNLKQRKGRSALTILSIFVGISTIFIFISFGLGLYNYVDEFTTGSSADKITIQPKGAGAPGMDDTFALSENDLDAIKKTSGVFEASGLQYKVVEIEQSKTKKFVFLVGLNPKKDLLTEMSNMEIFKGRNLEKGEKGKILLGYNYLIEDKLLPKTLDVNSKLIVQGEDLRVAGFYESLGNPQDDSNIYVTEAQFAEMFGEEKNYNMVIARSDPTKIDQTVLNIEKSLRKSRNLEEGKEDFSVASFADLLEQYTSVLGAIVGFIVLIALISVLVSAINTANTMITSVLERTKEIGIMKSIGARNSEILKIFLFESSFLGFTAGVIGVLFGWLITFTGGKILTNLGYGFLQPHYSIELFAGSILFATITGAISGVVPAIKASKTNPVDALRHD